MTTPRLTLIVSPETHWTHVLIHLQPQNEIENHFFSLFFFQKPKAHTDDFVESCALESQNSNRLVHKQACEPQFKLSAGNILLQRKYHQHCRAVYHLRPETK